MSAVPAMKMSFFSVGLAAPKGSAKAYVRGGRAVVTAANAKTKPWEGIVAADALRNRPPGWPLDRAYEVRMSFTFPRAKGHFNAKGEIKASAPRYHWKKPDCDKLVRCADDALTHVLWTDDSRVVNVIANKSYCAPDEVPGVWIEIEVLP